MQKQSDSKSVHDQVVRFASKCPAPIDLPEQNCRAHSNQRSGCHPVDKAPCDFIVEFWLFRTQIYRSKDKAAATTHSIVFKIIITAADGLSV